MKKHLKHILASFMLLSTVHTVYAQETVRIAEIVNTPKALQLEKELETVQLQRMKAIKDLAPWRMRFNEIAKELRSLRQQESDSIDVVGIEDKRKTLEDELGLLRKKRDSVETYIMKALAEKRDTLYTQYTMEITRAESIQAVLKPIAHKTDSIAHEIKKLYAEMEERARNEEPREDISKRILAARRDSTVHDMLNHYIKSLRDKTYERLRVRPVDREAFRMDMRAIEKVEAALIHLGIRPTRINSKAVDSWADDGDYINRRTIYQMSRNYGKYRDAYLAILPDEMREVVLRRSNEQIDSIAESRYQVSVLLASQLSDTERDSVLISHLKNPEATEEVNVEIQSTTMEEFLISPSTPEDKDVVKAFKDNPVYVVTLKKKLPDGHEIKITEQAFLQKTMDFIWGAIYQPGSQYQIPAEDTLTYETARRRYQRYGRYAYLSTLSPEVQYALERYRRPKFSLQDFERYQKQIQRQMDMVAEKHDSVLISRIKDPESKDTFVEIKSTTIEQLIAQPQDDREKDVIAVFKGFPIYAVTLNRRVPDGGVIKIAEQAVLQKTMDFLWGRAYLPSRIGYDAASIDTIPYHQIGVWINRYFPSATYLYTLPKDIRYAYLHRKGDVHDATRQEDRLRKNLNWVATMTDAQRDSVIRRNGEIDSNEQVHIKLVTLNDTTVAELNEQLNSNNKRLTEILNHFRGYPMYVVTHQKELEDGELFTSSIRMIFKETMTTIWRVAWMRGSTR
ncbi:hypothetical protein [Sphingobacterium sp. FBM7-1]|uniref:hypothetical protein n=1 Tax=Sphingobacterium sp. FBM7-1 TaxID=2886688 RepID=UPI001D1000DA|nr:hypothetical protein [Sphingobacterium sp. FBM7-1]MCC2600286.1 hypothetical protein [Sphingobacterium sp. FBM7-1]